MNYELKYLKYKEKYIGLKLKLNNKQKQIGGTQLNIPNIFPGTYSFLFMPLLYYTLDTSSVILPDGFKETLEECIRNINEINMLPFNNFDAFISHLRINLNLNGINNIEDLNKIKDGDHHIPGTKQEHITNYNTDDNINMIISCLANMMIERFHGKYFTYTK